MAKDDDQVVDKRVKWILDRVNAALRLKPAELKKFGDNEDNQQAMMEFLETADTRHIFIFAQGNSGYVARVEAPSEMKRKGMFFSKANRERLLEDHSLKTKVSFGDLNPDGLAGLHSVTKNVFANLVRNERANTKNIPDAIVSELLSTTDRFLSSMLVTVGLSAGRTLLPLPAVPLAQLEVNDAAHDRDLLYVLEQSVVQWTVQIQSALATSSEETFNEAARQKRHLGPRDEVAFWYEKRENLLQLEDQVYSDNILKVLAILKRANSHYYAPFEQLVEQLAEVSKETRDNYRFLKPLENEFSSINVQSSNKIEFTELVPKGAFKRIWMFVYLVWTRSHFYNTLPRLATLIRELCNDLIECARENVAANEIFEAPEKREVVLRLSKTLQICNTFKEEYFAMKTRCSREGREWNFQNRLIFGRLDACLERIHDLLETMESGTLFDRMEAIKIGGTQGEELTESAERVKESFEAAVRKFLTPTYDLLDLDEPQFEVDYAEFKEVMKNLEREMGSLLSRCLDDANSISSVFKAVHIFDGFTDRAIVGQQWLSRQGEVLETHKADLITVQNIFIAGKDQIPEEYPNVPPTAARLTWARALLERVYVPHERILELSPEIRESENGVYTERLYNSLRAKILMYVNDVYNEWAASVSDLSTEKLKLPLMKRDKDGFLHVNFDPELSKTLREVYYLELMNTKPSEATSLPAEGEGEEGSNHAVFEIPEKAKELFEHRDMYREQLLKIEHVCITYNNFTRSLREGDEKEILSEELVAFDQIVHKGEENIKWEDGEAIDGFLDEALEKVDAINFVAETMHGNLDTIRAAVAKYVAEDTFLPLNKVGGDKTLSESDFIKRHDKYAQRRRTELTAIGIQAHELVEDTLNRVNELKERTGSAPVGPGNAAWDSYLSYVDQTMRTLLRDSVIVSLKHLCDQLNRDWITKQEGIPLLEIKMSFTKPKEHSHVLPHPRYEPLLSQPEHSEEHTSATKHITVEGLINDVLSAVLKTPSCVYRFETPSASEHTPTEGEEVEATTEKHVGEESYEALISEEEPVVELCKEITALLDLNAAACRNYMAGFDEYKDLWLRDVGKSFKAFVEEGEKGQVDNAAANKPYFGRSLEDFDQCILEYERIGTQIETIETRHREGFVLIDVKPMRHALQSICKAWQDSYSQHLLNKIEGDLNDLNKFIDAADAGLDAEGVEESFDTLKQVMGWIRECQKRNVAVMGVENTDNVGMFIPIRDALKMLRQHTVQTEEEENPEMQQLEVLDELRKSTPDRWRTVYKKALNVRATNSVVQDREAERIKEDQVAFDQRCADVVAAFRAKFFFGYTGINPDSVYDDLDRQNEEFEEFMQEGKQLQKLQDLFDLTPNELRELKEGKQELQLLKGMWDLVNHVNKQFNDWMRQPFKDVDIGSLDEEIRKLTKQLKQQHIKVKSWDAYKGLEDQVKNMGASLPLCDQLSSDAMRERHWEQLVKTTHQTGTIDPKAEDFTLEKLISLGLHQYVEDVGSIVERAEKEKALEKQLMKIVEMWEKMTFTYDHNAERDIYMLGAIDEIVEQLEGDMNTLSSMLSNRFVEYFQEIVLKWQRNLSQVDSCVTKMTEIQRQWLNLFPIFVLSEDIKQQLPEDAKAFQGTDKIWRKLMDCAHNYTIVIDLICTEHMKEDMGRNEEFEDTLTHIQEVLTQCEKSLTDYLETKRKIFPRFFFVSATDLIDILSKGSNPRAVMVHMSKIVDSIDTFSLDENPFPNTGEKDLWQMVSIQGEKVPLPENYHCEGPVEVWLDKLITAMQSAVRYHIKEANTAYMDRPRCEWIYEHNCQAIIVASRIWFTTEVHQAFQQIEEGNDMGMKDLLKAQKSQLLVLTAEVLKDQNSCDRKMLVHLITIDVHNRDIVQNMVDEKVDLVDAFMWQSQLRYYWDENRGNEIRICDAEFTNRYEYIGLCGCLVITKLTDRCYITLSQALRLKKGGAPAGPAGTGKTETTKDLARNLGICCYVFNCSSEMSYITLGQIFKGLAMSGSWGCFDEFNRISIEVLSVVATQVGSILNALKENKSRFRFMDEEISIIPSVGMWITMNPGYAGRTELPENIKSLFRPCAMVVPDLKNICEIMLAAEGFGDAKDLALKFVTLYRLNRELLSPQDHYDWGLRAVKSVLYIAGALKRGDPETPERSVLMRALRDTNMAKLSKDDVYVFMGLVNCLFVNLTVEKKESPELVAACKAQCAAMGNLPGENGIFILRCVQYEELLHVRHSVFILGAAGCGKTECWRCLQGALTRLYQDEWKARAVSSCLNPKAITSNELYGYFTPQKEWRDGILSNIFREYAQESKKKSNMKWIILDGIIDAEWIESMNTVMDDNKMLTLVSNERIPLTASMRMIFEVSHLKNASPATVSRAGVVFINESDLGWGPFKDKWIASLEEERARTTIDNLFDKYVPIVFDQYHTNSKMKPVVSVMDINVVQTLCFIMEGILKQNPDIPKLPNAPEIIEKYFAFATVWAFGGPLSSDGRIDSRAVFNSWWRKEFPAVKMSDSLTVFDFFLDAQDYEWKPWSDLVQPYAYDPEAPLSTVTVQTADTVRMTQLMNLFVDNGRGVILVGTAGTGKTNLIMSKLRSLDPQQILFRVIAFNARTSSIGLQTVMEQSLEKRTGRTYGPPNRKKLVFFLDDVNMPAPDNYGTQESIALLQQHIGYGFWYDRIKIIHKEVVDIRYVAAMNPKSGTFTILDRVLRHFALFSSNMPDRADLVKIYGQIFEGHLGKFSATIQDTIAKSITNASIELHTAMVKEFLPTAIKFHYQWNMREMFNIFQGLCKSISKLHNDPQILIRLWIHECARTFQDRMPLEDDIKKYNDISARIVKAAFPEMDYAELTKEPLIWAPFFTTKEGDENVYNETNWETLTEFLSTKMTEYNDSFTRMDLVLFSDAMMHICRVARITSNPRGNALLVGVGGSGKQSLSRIASFINGQDIFQILVTSNYGINEFRTDVQGVYMKSGIKNFPFAFIITDSQIVSQEMLVYLNDMLSSGNVPELFNQDERDGIIGGLTGEAKALGLDYSSPDVVWDYFIGKVRSNLHIILCFSPVGQNFATWCRQFPALANTTVIDWFHPWPEQALKSVARRFLADAELGDEELTGKIADFMALCQEAITKVSEAYASDEKRYCYVTPKSFLELISLYKRLLAQKRRENDESIVRLESGITKIQDAGAQVAALQDVLARESIEVEEARKATAALLERVSAEKAVVEEQSQIAAVEEEKTNKIVDEVEVFAADCAKDLAAAQPLVLQARAALDTLDKSQLSELKNLGKPPDDVQMVAIAVKVLTSSPKAIPPLKNRSWAEAKKMMNQVDSFLKFLKDFDCDNIPQPCVDAVQMYVNNPAFEPQSVATKSNAASGLCKWVLGMNAYHTVRCEVRPKEEKLAEARARLQQSKNALKKIQDKVADLQQKLDTLMKEFNETVEASNVIEARAKKTRDKVDLAHRLVNGLADENVRWSETISNLKEKAKLLTGDVLLGSAFISYIGPFNKAFREKIMSEMWIPAIIEAKIPMTPELNVIMDILTSEAQVASWNNDGLPADPVSTENGAIVVNCARWPLMIDPQLQGIRWVRTKEEKNGLKVIQTAHKGWMKTLEQCIEEGLPCLLEGLQENIEPVLDNVLGRATYKKSGREYIKLGASEVEYNKKFRFFLQTKLSNPHYKPEVNAQTTLINFMVTETGLEDQLLAVVVNQERPDLEERRVALIRQMNTFTIELQQCEDNLLFELSNASGDILENVGLVENLEYTKKKASDINAAMRQAIVTREDIAKNRLTYTAVAVRGSLIFFQLDQLCKIDHMYQYSLEAFMSVFNKALAKAPQPEDKKNVQKRVQLVLQAITEGVFAYVSRGLFERHKLIFSSLLCFSILLRSDSIDREQLNFLLRGKKKLGVERPETVAEWCSEPNWAAVQALTEVEGTVPEFRNLPSDMADSNRWKIWCETEKPEDEKLPTDWKNLTQFQRLLVLRCLRPDRLTAALEQFVSDSIGKFFVTDQAVSLEVSFFDSTTQTPLFFILSAGVDPVRSIEELGRKLGYTYDNERLYNVSLGQGQEIVADRALENCFKRGGWAMLSNIHLVAKWLKSLEQRLEAYSEIYTRMAQIARRRAEKKGPTSKAPAPEEGAAGSPAEGAEDDEEGSPQEEGVESPQVDAEHPTVDGESATAVAEGAEAAPAEDEVGETKGENPSEAVNKSESAEGGDGNGTVSAEGAETNPVEEGGETLPEGEEMPAVSVEGAPSPEDVTEMEEAEQPDDEETESPENASAMMSEDVTKDAEKEAPGGEEGESGADASDEEEYEEDPELRMEGPRGHKDFRVFLTAEPSDVIPIGVLQRSIKLTSEPPTGVKANMRRAMANFSDEPWERSAKPTEFRCIMFSMCFFHAVVVERKKFGPQGWNRVYPFNMGDLTTCMEVTANYIEDRPKIPWEDLRYVTGEIMYGGHITDDWDRVLCMAYLQSYIVPECCDGLELAPGLVVPTPMNFNEYMTYITDSGEIPAESPLLYGLHPNAEINYRTTQAVTLFGTINELQPRQKGGGDVKSPAEVVNEAAHEILERLPEEHNLQDLSERLEGDRTPQQHVFYQECERMNFLIDSIRVSLEELILGLKGELSMTASMQLLQDQIFLGKVPDAWSKYSFMSMRPLTAWVENFQQRNQQLLDWIPEMATPRVTNISLFFNPMSFLTAIMQTTSMQNNYDLDQMALVVDVLKKMPDQVDSAARDGCHVFGAVMEGARWDASGTIDDSRMKELYPRMPVMTIRSLPLGKIDRRDQYECPVYKTQARGPGFVVGLFLKTKVPPRKWVIAGVALLLDVVE